MKTTPFGVRTLISLGSGLAALSLVAGCNGGGSASSTQASNSASAAPAERRTADGKIIRIADDGTEEICNAAPSTGNRPGIKAVNTTCPIVDADGADESVTADWNGKTIAFCCPTCLRKFNRMTATEKDAVLVKAMTYVDGA